MDTERLDWWDGGDHSAYQQGLWPAPEQLRLPEQLTLPEGLPGRGRCLPPGIEPVDPPAAPAALECVVTIVAEASARLGVARPEVRWFKPRPVGETEECYAHVLGVVFHWQRAIWLNIDYASPQQLATTTAHEVVHHWQNVRRGRWLDDLEKTEREGEAQRRAEVLVPKGRFRTPRGRRRDVWFEPSRRRYG